MDRGDALLDVTGVPPRHRFETIMSTYDALPAQGRLELVVDHDPRCMYYTLRATRGEEAFTFEYLEAGPLTWRVLVGKRSPGRQPDTAQPT